GQSVFSVLPPDVVAARRKTRRRTGARYLYSTSASNCVRYSREPRLCRVGETSPYPAPGWHLRKPDADHKSRGERQTTNLHCLHQPHLWTARGSTAVGEKAGKLELAGNCHRA